MLNWLNENLVYISIPLVSAFVGFGTNWLAVKMMMFPLDRRGFGVLGWQGVVPASAKKMSRVLVEQSIGKVISQQELVERIDFAELAASMSHRIDVLIHKIVDEVMDETQLWGRHAVSKFLWQSAPQALKNSVYKRVHDNMPEIIDSIAEDFRRDYEVIGNINEVIIERLEDRKDLLVEIFLNAAGREFSFLARSGFYFGFPLGIPVIFLWQHYPVWWLLPLTGLLVGYLTNELAIYMVQKPLQPRKVLGVTFQGLFVKRQKEISAYLGKIFSSQLLNARTLSGDLLNEPKSIDKIQTLVYQSVSEAYSRFPDVVRPFIVAAVGPNDFAKTKDIVTHVIMSELKDPDPRYYECIDRSMDIEHTLAMRLGNMPPDDFFALLQPVIAEDQWKLVVVGGVLGMIAGVLQWIFLT